MTNVTRRGRIRPLHHRRWDQRLRHCPRRHRPRSVRHAGRTGRPCAGHLLGLDQALPRRVALSGILRVPSCPRGAGGTRNPARRHAAHQLADALRAAPQSPDMRFENDTPTARLLRWVMPWAKGRRPDWLIRLGLYMYDTMGGRKILPATRTVDLTQDPAGKPLKPKFRKAFEYSDCWVEDSRLVALNARDAAQRGARILTRTRVTSAERRGRSLAGHHRRPARHRTPPGPRPGQCRWPLGRGRDPQRRPHQLHRRRPPGARQPYRDEAGFSTTTAATSSRAPTAASSLPSPMSRTSP